MENSGKKLIPNSDSRPADFTKKLVTRKWVEEFQISGKGWLIIISSSMSPLIRKGDQVFVEQRPLSDISQGDIIVFWRGNLLVSHRVIRKVRKKGAVFFVERGDQHPTHSTVSSALVIGKVTKIKRGEQHYQIDSPVWQLFNRIVGFGFFCTFVAKEVTHRIPFFPESVKNFAKKPLAVCKRLMEMFCRILINTSQKKH
jgi:signal peptidase I